MNVVNGGIAVDDKNLRGGPLRHGKRLSLTGKPLISRVRTRQRKSTVAMPPIHPSIQGLIDKTADNAHQAYLRNILEKETLEDILDPLEGQEAEEGTGEEGGDEDDVEEDDFDVDADGEGEGAELEEDDCVEGDEGEYEDADENADEEGGEYDE